MITQDVDILYRIEHDNLQRLSRALESLDAVVRDDPRRLRFGMSHLASKGHELADTNAGPLDILGSVNQEILLYEDLLPDAELMELGNLRIRVLRLARLIELKRLLGRPKDMAALPVLEATLKERGR